MSHLERTSLIVAITSLVFCIQYHTCTAFSIGQLTDNPDSFYKRSSWWPDSDSDDKRAGCHGFPCIFTHLGSKARDASMERIKMSILIDCLNDPHCFTQGRRKRLPPSQAVSGKLLFGRKRFANPLQWSHGGKRYIANPLQWSTTYTEPTFWKDRRPESLEPYRDD